MFSHSVALLFWCALMLLQSPGDAALTGRQYPPSADDLIVSPSLGATTRSTSLNLSSNLPASPSPVSLTSLVFSNTSSTLITQSPSATSTTLELSTPSTASSASTPSASPTAIAAESRTDESIPSSSGSRDALERETSHAEQYESSTYSPTNSSSNSSVANPSITSAPAANSQRLYNSSFPITSGPTTSGNASIRAPYIRFGCTPDSIDAWHDARSCSCQSRLYTYYATQSTGETISTVCHTSGEESYGLRYSPGCSLTTSPLLKTPWVAPDDCCGYCKIEVPTVRIVYWPPQTAAPNISYTAGNFSAPRARQGPVTVVEDGYTFTSPSVYIVYSSIRASASCIAMSISYHTVGGIHVVTRAYPPDHLSSVRCVNSIGIGRGQNSVVWEPINYIDLHEPIPLTKSLSRIDRCFTNRQDNDIWGDWMRKPFISLPKDVSEIDPTWTTCSGVAIGAMDPPRALVPAAGFEDPPPSAPVDPPSAEPLTQSAPSLPKATPGKAMPDPVPLPTRKPSEGADPALQPLPQPKPKHDPPNDSPDPPTDPQPDPSSPSPILKEPSKSPAAAAPQPQEPSPNPPAVKPSGDDINDSGHDITVRPPTQSDESGPMPPSGDQAKQPQVGPDPLKSISAVIFPSTLPNPSSAKQGSDGGSEGQVPNGQGQQSTHGGGSGQEESTLGQVQSGSHSTGSRPDSNSPPTADVQDQSPAPEHQPNSNDPATLPDGDRTPPSLNEQSHSERPGNSGGTETSPSTGGGGPKGSNQGEAVSNGNTSPPPENPETQPDSGPTAFAFVSNAPPPVAGGHTMARAPDGGAVVGTATIHPGEAQIVHGTHISVASNAIVVGSSTYPVTPPQKVETPAGAPILSQAPGGGLVIGSKTIMPGSHDSINGHEVSVGPSNVIVDGESIALPAMTPPPSVQPVDIGGVQISRGSGNNVVIGDSIYKPGAQVTVSGHTVSVGSGEVQVDETTYSLPSRPAGSPLLVDGQSLFKASNGHVIIGADTLTPGSETTMGAHVISIATNNVVLDQSTYALPSKPGVVKAPTLPDTPSMAPLTVGEHTISKAVNGALIIGSSTISPGNHITIAGHTISAAPDRVIVDDTTYNLPATAGAIQTPAVNPIITLPNGIVAAPGASAITVSEQVISVFPDGKGFVIDGSTITIPTATPSAKSVFTVAGQVFTAAPTGFAIDGTTISPGGAAVTISEQVISLFPNGKGLVIDGSTITIPTATSSARSIFTVAGEIFTAAPTGFIIGEGTTVSPGGAAVTVSGTVISLGTAGLRIGSKTFALPTSASTSTVVLGDVIMSGFGQGDGGSTAGGNGNASVPAPTGGVEGFVSGASRKGRGLGGRILGLGVGAVVGMMGLVM